MARKQSSTSETDQKPATNGSEPKRGTKTAAIRALIVRGVIAPKEIVEEMARQGLSVSMPVIYTTLKEMKKAGKSRRGPKPRTAAVAPGPANGPSPKASTSSAGVTADDLLQLAEITKKVGGVDAAVGLLNVMKHFQ
jgi:hypothetical protein